MSKPKVEISPAGYSGTPLPRKLGLKEGGTLIACAAPAHFDALLAPLPVGAKVTIKLAAVNDLIVLFVPTTAALAKQLPPTAAKLAADGALWIGWPKKSSPLFFDLTEDGIRDIVLPMGLVDVKVCAIDQDWSGLKLMVRKELRASWPTKPKKF